jgi:hypothetical protein
VLRSAGSFQSCCSQAAAALSACLPFTPPSSPHPHTPLIWGQGSLVLGILASGAMWTYYKVGPKRRYRARLRDMRSLRWATKGDGGALLLGTGEVAPTVGVCLPPPSPTALRACLLYHDMFCCTVTLPPPFPPAFFPGTCSSSTWTTWTTL